MKVDRTDMKFSLLALAVQAALVAMWSQPAHADDEEAAALKNPTNTVEIGAANTSQSSAKFGEYNGLNKSGASVITNFSVRGGNAYGDGNGTRRWAVSGNDLGTTSRSLGASVGNQGAWNIGVSYDELRHNLWDTYQTPYQGSMGGNNFVLPAGFGVVNSTAAGTTPVGTVALTPAQLAAFNKVDIYSTRKNGTFTAAVNLNEAWDFRVDFNRLVQSGAKLMGFGSMGPGGAGAVQGEVVSILPNPTNYRTDTLNLALNWAGESSHLTTSYFGSFFRDNNNGVTFQTFGVNNAGGITPMQTMSTLPSNDFHQLNLNGGHAFSTTTKLTGGLSYGRNTQNDSYAVDSFSMVTPSPTSSLNGLVANTHADLKLTDQTTRDLALSAAVKFDERRDHTASNLYNFNALDGSAIHTALFPNTPYSNRKAQLELAGDYRITNGQHLRIAYNRENFKRWCENYAVGGSGAFNAAGNNNNYPAGTNCVVAPYSKDDMLSANYKLRTSEDLNMNFGYSFSRRITTSDPNAITARIGVNGNLNISAGGPNLVWGQNAGDYRGFYPFFDASRREQMLKAGANWQATEKMNVALGGKYTDDKYDSVFGVQKGNSWSLNLDATYGLSENSSITAYLTQQHRQRELTDLQRSPSQPASTVTPGPTVPAPVAPTANAIGIPLGATWTDQLKDDETTVGIGAKQKELMGTKFDLTEDLTYSLGRTGYSTQLNYYSTTTGGLTCSSPQILSCGDLPVIRNRMVQLKLTGSYRLSRDSRISLGYLFQQLRSNDYYFNGLQYGYTPNTLLPTNQQAPSYTVYVVAAGYTYNF